MKRFVRSVTCIALAGGFSLLVGLHPAQAIQPWDVRNTGAGGILEAPGDPRINDFSSCKAQAWAVIMETAYQRKLGQDTLGVGITKDSYIKGIIGSVGLIALYIHDIDRSTPDATESALLVVPAAEALRDKLLAAIANASKRNPQMTTAAGEAILYGTGSVDSRPVSLTVAPQPYVISGTNNIHGGAAALLTCVLNLVD